MERHCMFMVVRLNIYMVILPKLIYRFNSISIEISAGFLCKNSQGDPKIHMEMKNKTKQNKTEYPKLL